MIYRTKFTLLAILATLLLILQSCTNSAYKRVATDPTPTVNNKKLLAQAYDRSFPHQAGKVKTDTTITISVDTAQNNSAELVNEKIKNYILTHPCNVDTAAIAKIISDGLVPKIISKTIQVRVRDSVPYEDLSRVAVLQLKYEDTYNELEVAKDALVDAKVDAAVKDTKIDNLSNSITKLHLRQWFGWIAFGLLIAFKLVLIYLKTRV